MCGIFGILWHDTEDIPDAARLKQTARLLHHRGPDDFGIYSEPGIGLVHTRLALLDLNPRSNQPFWDRTGRYTIVYNGEIYNFAELRTELEQQGVQFRTTSDTEVLLEALLKWGADTALPRFEGMFAFGLYDKVEQSLLLARDRFGIKPLFIYQTDRVIAFASEIGAFRPWIPFEPDFPSISAYLCGFSGPTRGATFYRNITILDPGGSATVTRRRPAAFRRFAFLSDLIDPSELARLNAVSDTQMVDRLDELVNESVKSQLVADAPVGGLCSGGIDSSIILAMAARHHNNLAVFHANVVGPLSELPAAQRLARHLKLDLKAIDIHPRDFIDKIPDVTEHYGHPFYPNPHSVPYMMVSTLVRQNHVKAVIAGEGADELFLGYDYSSPDIREWLHPKRALNALRKRRNSRRNSGQSEYLGLDYVAGARGNTAGDLMIALHNRLEVMDEAIEARQRVGNANTARCGSALQSVDLLHYNLRSILHRNDSMGMSASIEGRFPFLETRISAFALNMPHRCKIRFSPTEFRTNHPLFVDKWLLRSVADRYLPRELSRRAKKPFPINAYSAECLRIPVEFFRNSIITDLFGLSENQVRCFVDRASHELRLKMMQLDVWADICLRGAARESSLKKLRDHLIITN